MKFLSIETLCGIAMRHLTNDNTEQMTLVIVDGEYALLRTTLITDESFILCKDSFGEIKWYKLEKPYEVVVKGKPSEVLEYLHRAAEIDEEVNDVVPTLDELVELCRQWGKEKGLHDTNDPTRQTLKLVSEIGELAQAVIENDDKDIQDALGDALVVIIQICAVRGYNVNETLNNVYSVISKRKGKTVNGAFIKDRE